MKRMTFDSQGRLLGVDGAFVDDFARQPKERVEEEFEVSGETLRTSSSLRFLQDEQIVTIEPIKDESIWSLFSEGKKLDPLRFSNGKTQEDVVSEVTALIKSGKKVIFIHGMCGTGKSAIALNIARAVGRSCIVVPVKGLQRQYEEDYTDKKYVLKKNGSKLKIAMITGRDNHDSVIMPGVSCADPTLPENVRISEKNTSLLMKYYHENPLIVNKSIPDVSALKRISIAPANPYWSPILPGEFEFSQIKDARKKRYKGLSGKEFVFYHRKQGCSYYDQYLAYFSADVLIFNAAKYKIEVALDRKPETAVDIIDEADEFLDSFSTQEEFNISRLLTALKSIYPDHPTAKEHRDTIVELLDLEEKNKRALGINENQIYSLHETKLEKIFSLFLKHPALEAELALDETNYAYHALEVARSFRDSFADTYVTYYKREEELCAQVVCTNLSQKFSELVDKSKALVFMSGTLHSEAVLREIFGIKDFTVVQAETATQGSIDIIKTGKEFDCKYSTFKEQKKTRHDYLSALSAAMEKAHKPTLVHVNAFEDLPSEYEQQALGLANILSREKLQSLQLQDKTGKSIALFKSKLSDVLFSTKCARGVDFAGDLCNSIVFTKYPNPNIQGVFWKVLAKTHPHAFWDFYRDKAQREFLQRMYRALRSKDDHVFVLSPDSRVLAAVREMQMVFNKKV